MIRYINSQGTNNTKSRKRKVNSSTNKIAAILSNTETKPMGAQITVEVNGNEYTVLGTGLRISTNDSDTVTFDDVAILKNGKEVTDFSVSFGGTRFTVDDVASELIRNSINGGVDGVYTVNTYNPIISQFRDRYTRDFITVDGRKINKKYLGEYGELELQLVNLDGMAYYTNLNEFIILRSDKSIATDMETFWENEFHDDLINDNIAYQINDEEDWMYAPTGDFL